MPIAAHRIMETAIRPWLRRAVGRSWAIWQPRLAFRSRAKCLCTVPQSSSGKPSPLKGITILDLSRVVAGPFSAQILADYGANVIKVEQPGKGDETRHFTSSAERSTWDPRLLPMSHYFASLNRNKRSIALDLKDSRARNVLFKLVERCDVVIENMVPGKMDELGLGYAKLSEMNHRLIYASVSGYGAQGPWAKRAGYDMIVGAEAGLMHITGQKDGPPTKPGISIIDLCTGLYLHGAIMAALLTRQHTGRGQKVDISLFETQVSLLTNVAMDWINQGQEAQRWGTAHPTVVPYEAWKTKDAYFVTGAATQVQFRKLCQILTKPELVEDERFITNAMRVKNRDELLALLRPIFEGKNTDEWLVLFEGSGLPYGSVNTIEQVFKHPQIEARNMVQTVNFDGLKSGSLHLLGSPVKFSDADTSIRQRPPLLGEHTSEVLRDSGISDAEINELRATQVIQ